MFKFSFLTLLLFFCNQSFSQKDSLSIQDSIALQNLRINQKIKAGLQVELLGVSLFIQPKINKRLSVGLRFGLGVADATFVLLGDEHFATDYSFRYEERDFFNNEFYTEKLWLDAYLEYRFKKFDMQFGYRNASFSHSNQNPDNFRRSSGTGKFNGLFVQPMFGKKFLKVGFRIQAGELAERTANKRKAFGIIVSPLVLTITPKPISRLY